MCIKMNHPEVDTIVHHYLMCALFASTGENDEPLEGVFFLDDIAEEAKTKAREDVTDFLAVLQEQNIAWREFWTLEQFGHDLFLTRNRHGAGFWDRYGANNEKAHAMGAELSTWAHSMGTVDFYVGDDGSIYSQ